MIHPLGLGLGVNETLLAPYITSLSKDANGTSIIANVVGTNTIGLYYRVKGATTWIAGSTRVASGTITQAVPELGWYELCAVSYVDSHVTSLPSNIAAIQLISTATSPAIIATNKLIQLLGAPLRIQRAQVSYSAGPATTVWTNIATVTGNLKPMYTTSERTPAGLDETVKWKVTFPLNTNVKNNDKLIDDSGVVYYVKGKPQTYLTHLLLYLTEQANGH